MSEPEEVDAQPVSGPDYAAQGRKGFRLTDERYDAIIQYVEQGNYLTVAAAAVGISERTLMRWLAVGKDIDERLTAHLGEEHELGPDTPNPHPELFHNNDWKCWQLNQNVRRAEAQAEIVAVLHIRKAMGDNWTAAMTYLERKHSSRWRRTDRHEVITNPVDTAGDDDLLEVGGAAESHEALRRAAGLDVAGELGAGDA